MRQTLGCQRRSTPERRGVRAGRAQMEAAMKAIVIHEFGNPSVLNLEDVPQPTLEAGEITIKVRAATVNQTSHCVPGNTQDDRRYRMCWDRMRPARLPQ